MLLTGDADFVPVVEATRDLGPHVLVVGFRTSMAAALCEAADRVGYLPDDFPTASGVMAAY